MFLHSSSSVWSVECCGVFNLKPSTATGTTYIIVDFIFGRFSSEMRKQHKRMIRTPFMEMEVARYDVIIITASVNTES